MNLVVFASGAFAVPSLERLFSDKKLNLQSLYTRPPKKAGRGKKQDYLCAVHEWALQKKLDDKIHLTNSINTDDEKKSFGALKPDIAIVIDYGLKLPDMFLSTPRWGCINLHPSLLPLWRGAAPVPYAIISGENQTGISLIRLVKAMDAGPVLMQEKIMIAPSDTSLSLALKLADIGASLLVSFIDGLRVGRIFEEKPQDETKACYAPKLTKELGRVHWQQTASQLMLKFRAFTPFPGLWFMHRGERIRIIEAEFLKSEILEKPGYVLNSKKTLDIFCTQDALRIHRLQRAGRPVLDARDFLKGFAIEKGGMIENSYDDNQS